MTERIENAQRTVLAGILQAKGQDALDRYVAARGQLSDDHFTSYEKACWLLLAHIVQATGHIPTYAQVDHKLPGGDLTLEAQAEIRTLWMQLEAMPPIPESDFRYALTAVHDERKQELFTQGLAQASEILTFGKRVENKDFKGYDDSRRYLEDQLMRIDSMEVDSMPEGNIRTETDDLLNAYRSDSTLRLPTGWEALDRITGGGFGPGELWLIAGYTSEGKSMACVNMAHHMMLCGFNVVYMTTETLRSVVARRAAIRHSRLDWFGVPGGLSYKAVRDNQLTPEQYVTWQRVVSDFTNQERPYGRFEVIQVGEGTNMTFVRSKLRAYDAAFGVDAVFLDELQMFASNRQYEREQSERGAVLRSALQMAVDFGGGRGVPVVSPWQMKREAWEAARNNGGRYTRSSLGETSEAERRSTGVVSMFLHPDNTHKISAQVLKNRDGELGEFSLQAEFDHSFIGSSVDVVTSNLPTLAD